MASDKKRSMRFYIILLTIIIFIFWLYFFKNDLNRQLGDSGADGLGQIFSGFFGEVRNNLKDVDLKPQPENNSDSGQPNSLSPQQLDYLLNRLAGQAAGAGSSTLPINE